MTTYLPEHRLEDAEFLASVGEPMTRALPRLGYRSREGFRRLCVRENRLDIYDALAGKDAS